MKPCPGFLLVTLGAVLAFGFGSLAAEEEDPIHICRDEHGNEVYQTNPCPEVPEKKIAPEPPVEPTPKVPAPAPPKTPAPTNTPPPPPPKAPASTSPQQSTPAPARRSATSWTMVPRQRRAPASHRRKLGKQSFPTSLAGTTPSMTPSFASPEHTWRTFLVAIETDDAGTAAACLTPAALQKIESDAAPFPLADLRQLVSSFTRIEDEGDVGVYWSIYGVRTDRRPKWIFFEETTSGEWKIAGI